MTDTAEALAQAVAEAVAGLEPPRAYTLERLGHAGWVRVPGSVLVPSDTRYGEYEQLESGAIPGLANAMAEAANLSIVVKAGYRVVSPVGRVMAVYSTGDLVEVPLVIPA